MSLKEAMNITCKLLLILIGVGVLGYFLAATRLPFVLAEFVTGLAVNRYLIFAAVLIFFMILGCLLNVIPMILLVLPTIFPAIVALGFDPIWFGVVCVFNNGNGADYTPHWGKCLCHCQCGSGCSIARCIQRYLALFPGNDTLRNYSGYFSTNCSLSGRIVLLIVLKVDF